MALLVRLVMAQLDLPELRGRPLPFRGLLDLLGLIQRLLALLDLREVLEAPAQQGQPEPHLLLLALQAQLDLQDQLALGRQALLAQQAQRVILEHLRVLHYSLMVQRQRGRKHIIC